MFTLNEKFKFTLLLLFIILTRIPFLFNGYGVDGDSWRVGYSASTLWHEHEYKPSRPPGFPVYEILTAPFVGLGGSVASNTATLVVFLFAVYLFRSLLKKFEITSGNFLLCTFAFFPILWKNSAITMDYIWGLTLLLLSLKLLMDKRFHFSAIVLGIAAGTRITHILFIPLFIFLLEKEERQRSIVPMISLALLTTLCSYLPVFFSDTWLSHSVKQTGTINYFQFRVFAYRSIYTIGLLGFLALAWGIIISQRQVFNQIRANRYVQFELFSLFIMLSLFLIFPGEREYLIPTIPFLLLLAGSILKKPALIVFCVSLLSYSFVSVDIIEHGLTKQTLSPHITEGIVFQEYNRRNEQLEWKRKFARLPIPDSSIVMLGTGTSFWFENALVNHTTALEQIIQDNEVSQSRLWNNVFYVYSLTYDELLDYKKRGFQIFYVDESREFLESFLNYDLSKAGALPLHLAYQGGP